MLKAKLFYAAVGRNSCKLPDLRLRLTVAKLCFYGDVSRQLLALLCGIVVRSSWRILTATVLIATKWFTLLLRSVKAMSGWVGIFSTISSTSWTTLLLF